MKAMISSEQGMTQAELPSRASGLAMLRPLFRNPVAAASWILIAALVVVALLAPLVAPHDPTLANGFETLRSPSADHWLGTDQNGRDELSRLIYGTRISLTVGLIAVGVAVLIGVPLGLISGYRGGFVDSLIMRVMDSILAFPAIFLALAIVSILGTGLAQIMIAIGITSVPVYARIVRASVLSLKNEEFITAAVAIGARTERILTVHILPNTVAPIIVQASLGMGFAILSEASLSFLGLGVKPPTPTWGNMLQTAVPRIYDAAALSVYPGLAIFFVVLAFNILGDELRDALDPRLRGRLH